MMFLKGINTSKLIKIFTGVSLGAFGGTIIYQNYEISDQHEKLKKNMEDIKNLHKEIIKDVEITKVNIENNILTTKKENEELISKVKQTRDLLDYLVDTYDLNAVGEISNGCGAPLPYNPLHNELIQYGLPGSCNLWYYDRYISSMNYERRIPNWVIQKISSEDYVNKIADRKHSYFNNNTKQVPEHFRAANSDYYSSGWSRGHMIPAGDNICSQEAMNQTFLLNPNIVPQDLGNNVNFWYRIEAHLKSRLTKLHKNLIVVSGPLFIPNIIEKPLENIDNQNSTNSNNNNGRYRKPIEKKYLKHQVIGSNNVAVPTHLYKVVLVEPKDNESSPLLLGAFVIPNEDIPNDKLLTDYEVPIHYIEKNTGLLFFKKLNHQSDIKPLCGVPEFCSIMPYAELDKWNIPRRIGWSKSKAEMDKVVNEAIEKNYEIDQKIQDAINEKLKEFN